jgi:N-acetylglucosaminyl-diphospho-decaprenol L-rhamnosyltransferase
MTAIVIVNWNSGKLLENCIHSLLRNSRGTRIVVVDNASTDTSLQFGPENYTNCTLIRNCRNRGFAAACNQGWRIGSDPHVLFLNPDVEVFPGSVGCLEKTIEMDAGVWAAGGQLLSPSGSPQPKFNVRPFPTVWRVAFEMLLLDRLHVNRALWSPRAGAVGPAEVDQPAAACLMVTRQALEKIGGFDERFYPAWFEDVDLCRRIRDGGGRILYQPAARFLHHGGYSLQSLSRRNFLEFYHTNQIRYFQKHQGPRAAARVRRLIATGLLLRCAASLAYPLAPASTRVVSAKIFWGAARCILKNPGARG